MQYAVAAANGGPVTEQNMFVHRWFNRDKSCPGQWLYERQGQIANEVNALLKSGASTSIFPGQYVSVDYTNFRPYIARIDRKSTEIPYSKFSENKIIGCMVEGGYLFKNPILHNKEERFENPKLLDQITNLKNNNMPYGLYVYCRANSSADAKAEMYYFSFPLRRYVPKLGAWIYVDFDGVNSIRILWKDGYNV